MSAMSQPRRRIHPSHGVTERVVYVERERRRFNGETVLAALFSWLWLFGIGSLLGLIFGLISVRKCQREDMSGEWLGHIAWITGLLGLLATVAFIASGGAA